MFAKVYTQIFASSIAENYTTRHVFMDLLVLADSEGVVDMTLGAIARTTNVPLEVVKNAIQELSEPDSASRTPGEDGRRIALIDSHRDWGWRIINYAHYRALRDEEARRNYNRDYMQKYRAAQKGEAVSDVNSCKDPSTSVKNGKAPSTHAEAEGEAEGIPPKPPKGGGRKKQVSRVTVTDPLALRIGALFGRRDTTPWQLSEWEKFKELSPTEAEVQDMEAYYNSGEKFLRQNLATLLNNWMGELDKALKNSSMADSSPNI